jgi:hypothetical protein
MKRFNAQAGFSMIIALAAVLVVAVAGFAAWRVSQSSDKTAPSTNGTGKQQEEKPESKNDDPAEDGKYLVIWEWGVRVEVPEGLRGKVTYSLGDAILDPDGTKLQAAEMLVATDAPGDCASVDTPAGSSINAATQILRVENAKPFDTKRYKGTFKVSVLSDDSHVYHLSYVPTGCSTTEVQKQIDKLQIALEKLKKL